MYTPPLFHWPSKSKWNHTRSPKRVWNDFSIYLHYPYCRRICDFCGYETRLINKASAEQIVNLYLDEISHHFMSDDFSNANLNAIFFGGGTASLMKPIEIARVIDFIGRKTKNGLKDVEITLECEPGTVNTKRLKELKKVGVNRISVCGQSFSDDDLKSLTRSHNSTEVYKLVDDCVAAGFENIHLDLIFGVPGQTIESWLKSIEIATSMPFVHLSMYRLYVFKYGKYERDNKVVRPEKQSNQVLIETELMFNEALKISQKAGFHQYSLTEFAKKDRECKYILNAFDGSDILPIGPSAFGGTSAELWENSPYVHKYSNALEWEEDKRVFNLNNNDLLKRQVVLGLWLLRVDLMSILNKLDLEPSEELIGLLNKLTEDDLIYFDGEVIHLLPKHRYNAGLVMQKLDKLDASLWTTNNENLIPMKKRNQSVLYKHPDFNALNSIIRMSRRDPDFYSLLKKSPELTIENIKAPLNNETKQFLINVISGKTDFPDIKTDIEVFMIDSWRNVVNEHVNQKGTC